MKKNILFIIIAVMFFSCKEEQIGQYPVDSVSPGPVSNVRVVETLPGGALITYDLPDDRDLLYVKANYTLDTGQKMEVKSSMYGNTIKIEGFAKSEERNIELRAVDRSQNQSEPVNIKVIPDESAIYEVLKSLKVYNDFGGIMLSWVNESKDDVVIMVSKPISEESEMTESVRDFYTSAGEGIGYIRGFEPKPQKFIFQVKDRWGNITDIVEDIYNPMYEEKVQSTNYFSRWNGDPEIPYRQYSNSYVIEKLWDGITMYGTSSSNFFHTPAGQIFPIRFSFDMGQVYTLSRFKLYQRGDKWAYEHGNPKKFRIYGSTDIYARLTPVDPLHHEWELLGEFESVKPSGLPLGQRTAEDIDKGAGGEDYNFPLDKVIPVRYLMVEIITTWGGTEMIHISELEFWGQKQ